MQIPIWDKQCLLAVQNAHGKSFKNPMMAIQEISQKRPKAIALLSGGLDSALAAKIVKDQGVEVIGLHLLSPFGCKEDVQKVADGIGIPLIVKEKGPAYLDLVENPRYGYGKNMNPCIDCRIFMFQLADVVLNDLGADFIVTGEVLGQRPMSQVRRSIEMIDSQSPLGDKLLRPLSAHRFPETLAERNRWVKREALLNITGRARNEQLKAAETLGITQFGAPGGGCLLTDAQFSKKLSDFFAHKTHATPEERLAQAEMLHIGRHFRFHDSAKAIIARTDVENKELRRLWPKTHGALICPENFEGPIGILFGTVDTTQKENVAKILARYGKSQAVTQLEFSVSIEGQPEEIFTLQSRYFEEDMETYRI